MRPFPCDLLKDTPHRLLGMDPTCNASNARNCARRTRNASTTDANARENSGSSSTCLEWGQ